MSRGEYEKAVQSGTKHGFTEGAEKTYYSTSDGRYFYNDRNGKKNFVNRGEYEKNLRGSPSKKRANATGTKFQDYYNSVAAAEGLSAT